VLALLDADDYWLPAYLERQVSLYDSAQAGQGDVGIVACNASLLWVDGFRESTHMEVVRFPHEVTLLRIPAVEPRVRERPHAAPRGGRGWGILP